MILPSVAKTREMMALLSGSPGTMGVIPERLFLVASSRISSLSPAMRDFASGPWHRKQVSDMMGRMSRLKRTGGAAYSGRTNDNRVSPASACDFMALSSLSLRRDDCGLLRKKVAGVGFDGVHHFVDMT